MSKKIAILGSTGSIGISTLTVVKKLKPAFEVVGLTANSKVKELAAQVRAVRPKMAAIMDESLYPTLKKLAGGGRTKLLAGVEGVEAVAAESGAPLVLSAIVGAAGLRPTLKALEKGKDIALANKETLVMAGEVVAKTAKKSGSKILPVDSEHCAIFQCLAGSGPLGEVHKILLTASGGPFRDLPRGEFRQITRGRALKHPTWRMGPKITIDSATLMNKGLEVIEAHYLFGLPYDRIDVVIHPESIIHSMVEYIDGSVLAQLGTTDMQIPIQYAMTYPRRAPAPVKRLDLTGIGRLHFGKPDRQKFPCLDLAYAAGEKGGTAPAVLNAANEVAVDLFLKGKISFVQIPRMIAKVAGKHRPLTNPNLDAILKADRWAREEALSVPSSLR
ncbi:MAG TPA: 1-deoxy-D-xylulose-5-phosphate reductoisomerase [bacterium]|nr:1-deoxy-D-xylulose-5-phosphate reductoisomerase [bacterium]